MLHPTKARILDNVVQKNFTIKDRSALLYPGQILKNNPYKLDEETKMKKVDKLTKLQYLMTQYNVTEYGGTGPNRNIFQRGFYHCIVCDQKIIDNQYKVWFGFIQEQWAFFTPKAVVGRVVHKEVYTRPDLGRYY